LDIGVGGGGGVVGGGGVLRGRGGLRELALGHASLPGLLAGSSGLLVFLELLRITLVVNRDDVVAHLDSTAKNIKSFWSRFGTILE